MRRNHRAWAVAIIVLVVVLLLGSASVFALGRGISSSGGVSGRRVALVIGNNNYRHVKKLKNAVTDAQSMRTKLQKFGFDVVYAENADRRTTNNAIDRFIGKLSTDAVGLLFYAGHGVRLRNGANYLLPVDLDADNENHIAQDAVELNALVDRMSRTQARFSLAIVDACRNNPFPDSHSGRAIGNSRGLAAPSGNASGVVIVYSAGTNQIALDRLSPKDKDPNGLFTREFLKIMDRPGLKIQDVVYEVKQSVVKKARAVNHTQTPAIYDQSIGTFYFVAQTKTYAVTIQTTPENAHIEFTNIDKTYRDGMSLAAGRYDFKVSSRGYKTFNGYVTVEKDSTWTVELERESSGMEFVKVPGGTFEIGCGSWQSDCNYDETPVQTVSVGGFEIGKYEVTQGQWQAIMGSNPSKFSSCGDDCPVEKVSWEDAQKFIKKLNAKGRGEYRLPTEAEWEYACRSGGKSEKYCGGNEVDRVAWYNGNSGDKTHRVGQKSPNGLGIYDMSGNVYEWTCSDYGYYGRKNHAKCNSGVSARVFRGGSWSSGPAYVRSARRNLDPGSRGNLGFRLTRTYR